MYLGPFWSAFGIGTTLNIACKLAGAQWSTFGWLQAVVIIASCISKYFYDRSKKSQGSSH